jgi:hypothetical protein
VTFDEEDVGGDKVEVGRVPIERIGDVTLIGSEVADVVAFPVTEVTPDPGCV